MKASFAQDPPVIASESATSVRKHGATLSGTVNPDGASTTCRLEYGTSVAYRATVPCSSGPGSGTGPVVVAIPALRGLASHTTYHYRIDATNAGGTTNGPDRTFRTLRNTCATHSRRCRHRLKCKKGFKKSRVHGKIKCVKARHRLR